MNFNILKGIVWASVSLALVAAATPRLVHAAESFDNCTGFITSLPATIATQGTWCLKQDLSTSITSGVAITIANHNVTIDCNHFKLGGLSAGLATNTLGIYAEDRVNATVRHCNVRGFLRGLHFSGTSGGHIVEDNSFQLNTTFGIYVEGDGSIIRRNRVLDTGGSTSIPAQGAVGIRAEHSVDVLDNTVTGVAATAGSSSVTFGISTLDNFSGSISGNRVRNLVNAEGGTVRGISNSNSGRITLRNNDVVGDSSLGSVGLRCFNLEQSPIARAKDNVIGGFATALAGCGDAGGNDITP